MSDSIVIPRRFRGPDNSGNGGYTAGLLAAQLPPGSVTEITLRMPPPLDVPLALTASGDTARLDRDGNVVAEAKTAGTEPTVLPPVSPAAAQDAMTHFAGYREHPFVYCYTCGTARADGDGLRIFPGPIDADTVAATWTPQQSQLDSSAVATVVAALDCPGGWAAITALGRAMVLGRITVRIDELPRAGETYVIAGAHLGTEGRKSRVASTLFDADGRVLATTEHVWITVDATAFNR